MTELHDRATFKQVVFAFLMVLSACATSQDAEQVPTPSATTAISRPASTTTTFPAPTSTSTTLGRPTSLPFELIEGEVVQLVPEVLASVPHPIDVFTQGLEIRDGLFYESAGTYGESRVRVFTTDGVELGSAANSADIFGEGLTLVDDRMIQITWREQTALVWDLETLSVVERFSYEGEGWGICLADTQLIMSNGTSTLTFRDPQSFEQLGTVEVTLGGRSMDRLNELECIDRYVLANVWQSDLLLIIDPGDGAVVGLIDATNLRSELVGSQEVGVLNGIAYDDRTGALYLTGKNWPEVFEVRLRTG